MLSCTHGNMSAFVFCLTFFETLTRHNNVGQTKSTQKGLHQRRGKPLQRAIFRQTSDLFPSHFVNRDPADDNFRLYMALQKEGQGDCTLCQTKSPAILIIIMIHVNS